MKPAKAKQNIKKVFRVLIIIKNIVLWTVIAFLALVLIVSMYSRLAGKAPSLFGYSLYRVSSGSMQPELMVGDIILVQQCDGATVLEDDIVSYNGTKGEMEGRLVTHRVVKAPYTRDGETWLVTRGDANKSDDPPITADQVTGKLVTKLSFLNWMFDFFATPFGLLTLIGLIILAFFNEIVLLVKSILGIEDLPEESVDQIIERYQKEALEKRLAEEAEKSQDGEQTDPQTEDPQSEESQ